MSEKMLFANFRQIENNRSLFSEGVSSGMEASLTNRSLFSESLSSGMEAAWTNRSLFSENVSYSRMEAFLSNRS